MVQTEVPATPIDVDGQTYADGTVNEFDILQLTNGYIDYDMLGGELNMNVNSPWVTGINVLGVDYPGVDTAPRQVMFTTVNAAISTFTFKTGANSMASASHQRLRSVYFKKFLYPNSFLPLPALASFSGTTTNGKVMLEWKMLAANSIKQATVERSDKPGQFTAIGEVLMNTGTNTTNNYGFTDNTFLPGTSYYRLRMTSINNQVLYSNVLLFRTDNNQKQSFKIYPSVISDNATVNILSEKNEQTSLQIFDMNGHTVYKKKIDLAPGSNTITVYGLGILQQGTYIASVKAGATTHSQKIMVR